MSRLAHPLGPVAASVVAAACLLVACGGNAATVQPTLSAAGEAGRELARSAGCAACHGPSGEGGTGPVFVGLYGSTVELRDGETVVADEAYLYEAITDPAAKQVAGYGFNMPTNDLSDAEVEQVIAFIRDLADPGSPTEAP